VFAGQGGGQELVMHGGHPEGINVDFYVAMSECV